MIYDISIVVAVLIFAILTIFIVRTLISLQKTLCRVNQMTLSIESKMNNLDSTLHAVSNLGDICENETERLKSYYFERKSDCVQSPDSAQEFAEWVVLSVKLGDKILNRRKL